MLPGATFATTLIYYSCPECRRCRVSSYGAHKANASRLAAASRVFRLIYSRLDTARGSSTLVNFRWPVVLLSGRNAHLTMYNASPRHLTRMIKKSQKQWPLGMGFTACSQRNASAAEKRTNSCANSCAKLKRNSRTEEPNEQKQNTKRRTKKKISAIAGMAGVRRAIVGCRCVAIELRVNKIHNACELCDGWHTGTVMRNTALAALAYLPVFFCLSFLMCFVLLSLFRMFGSASFDCCFAFYPAF